MLNKLRLATLCWVAGAALSCSHDAGNKYVRPPDAASSASTAVDLAPPDAAPRAPGSDRDRRATKPPKCYDLSTVRSLMAKAEHKSDELGIDNTLLYAFITAQNPLLDTFRKKLSSDSAADKVTIVNYLLFKYPVMVGGEKGRMMHHHRFVVRDASKAALLKQKLLLDTPDSDMYQFSFTDYQSYELSEYDNVRYAWENPYFRMYLDGRSYDYDTASKRFSGAAVRDSGPALVIEHFKNTLDRSPDNLSELYGRFKAPFFTVVGAALYRKVKFDVTVDTLLEAYEYFTKDDPAALSKLLHDRCFGVTSPKMRSAREAVASGNWYWYYSFWARRQSEGNLEVVLKVLREVQAHYGKGSSVLCTSAERGKNKHGSDSLEMPVF